MNIQAPDWQKRRADHYGMRAGGVPLPLICALSLRRSSEEFQLNFVCWLSVSPRVGNFESLPDGVHHSKIEVEPKAGMSVLADGAASRRLGRQAKKRECLAVFGR